MVDETQTNEPIEFAAAEAVEVEAAAAPEPIEEPKAEAAPEERRPLPVVGEPTPSSLDNMSDAELFGAHLSPGSEYTGTFRTLSEGDVVKGEIVRIDREGVLVDVGQKSEGLIKPQEMGRENADEAPLAVGDTVDVMVMQGETPEGQLLLSKKRADFEKAWDHVIEAQQNDEIIQAMVTDRVKGGLVVDLGIRGFIPASHVGNGKVRNLEKYIGEALPLKVIEVDKERRKVVLSHRLATEGEREKQREETLETLREGQVRAGVVRRITDYGAFVDLGGVDGLLHISEMSWSRIKHPNEVVKQGQEIQVMVLKVNLEQGRISLGMRQILPDPWTEASKKYHSGDIIEGKISRLVQSGAFMALDGGIEGFIKNSELAQRRVARPEDVVKVGDAVQVKVLDVRPDERRIELSRKSQEKREEREQGERGERGDRGDRQAREYRQKQPDDRFTLGDSQGDALAAYKAELEAAEAEAAAATPEEAVEAAPEVAEAAPEVVEAAPEVAETAPEVVEAAPEVVEPTPEVVEAAPEATEATEETAEVEPKAAE
ncbi:MAG TPA: 30S ribosomal protein S1 [Armatimonadota bacterium]|jgi:4-hydroxy-3-methylbut-2-enyl diphosphate reductase